jgi:hypothetical protein
MLKEDSIRTLELICDYYTNIATLKTSVHNIFRLECADYKLDNSLIAAEALDLLDARFRAILLLKEVIINVYMYNNNGLSDNLRKKMCDCGWTIKVTKVEKKKYANYKEYLKMKREEEREAKWKGGYYKRRRDLY